MKIWASRKNVEEILSYFFIGDISNIYYIIEVNFLII